jgi:CelD/BcsL family acetyltransferase involved in cellulose biosynthesis
MTAHIPDLFRIGPPGPHEDAEWERLALATNAPPFMRPGWLRCWADAFRRDLELATVRRAGELVAVLPVVRRAGALVSAANSETPGFDAVVKDHRAALLLLRAITDCGFRKIDLAFLPANGTTAPVLQEIQAESRGEYVWHTSREQPYLNIDGGWSDYLEDRVSSKQRRELRRLERRLGDAGTVEFEVGPGKKSLDDALEEGFAIEARGWKGRAGTAVLSRRSTASFYWRVARWAADEGILRLAFLRVDGRAVAFCFTLVQNEVQYGLKICHDETLASASPGVVHLHRLLEHACNDPLVTRFELLGEADAYKVKFAHGCTEQLRVQVFGPGWTGTLSRAAEKVAGDARNTARELLPDWARRRLLRIQRLMTG